MLCAMQHRVSEWDFTAQRPHADPWRGVTLDVLVTDETGGSWRVPTFWAGEGQWRVRFAPPAPGSYAWRSECSDTDDAGLHGQEGTLEAVAYDGRHPLYQHGPLTVSEDKRHFQHADGPPFFWLGDTWWMALTKRMGWPEDFQALAADRTAKGFNVVQIVAGLYPDMDWGDPRGENEAGLPYTPDFSQINPAYYDLADLKIRYLTQAGLMPCVVGCWGYFLPKMGADAMKAHWRHIIARWGAYPVVWCVAGEAMMPYYLSTTPDEDKEAQKTGWTELARYVHATDPMKRLVSIHPMDIGRNQVSDPSVLDFDMLQSGHSGYDSIGYTMWMVQHQCAETPRMPVIDSEVNYEGFLHGNTDEVQRMAFWGCILSGAAGHTYGANGIWQVNTRDQAYGPSPHGNTWGDRPWDEAMRLPGSGQLGVGKAILEQYRWWEFTPHPEWVNPAADEHDRWNSYCAGIPRQVRVIYTYKFLWGRGLTVKGIEEGVHYQAQFINPSTGQVYPLGAVEPDAETAWLAPQQPELRDWLLVLEAEG